MMSGHTPGPWYTHTNDFGLAHGSVTYVPVEDGNKTVAYVIASHPVRGDYPYRENAHLIAAAPDMLEVLKALLPEVDAEIEQRQTSGSDEYWFGLKALSDTARAAIAKAEGLS